ncbi:MAG: hypothetical protein ACO1NU_07540 [Arcticibacter sp.]
MKKAILFLAALICTLHSFSQQTSIKNIVTINLPSGSKKIANSKVGSISTEYSRLSTESDNVEFYKIDSVVFQFAASPGEVPQDHLEQRKKGMDDLYETANWNHKSVIETINGIKYLTVYYEHQGTASISVTGINKARNKGIVISTRVDMTKKTKAEKIMKQLIKTIKFSE